MGLVEFSPLMERRVCEYTWNENLINVPPGEEHGFLVQIRQLIPSLDIRPEMLVKRAFNLLPSL